MNTTGIRAMLLVRLAGLLFWRAGSAETPGGTLAARAGSERGAVPGWVMITLG